MFVEPNPKSPEDMAQLLSLLEESDKDLIARYRKMAERDGNLKVVTLIDDFILTNTSK